MRKGNLFLMICLFCVLHFIVFIAVLNAADILVHVPVELANMPSTITSGAVSCIAYRANQGAVYTQAPLGSGQTQFTIMGNNYNAMVDVIIKNPSNNPLSIGWTCNLLLRQKSPDPDRAGWINADMALRGYQVDTSKTVRYITRGTK